MVRIIGRTELYAAFGKGVTRRVTEDTEKLPGRHRLNIQLFYIEFRFKERTPAEVMTGVDKAIEITGVYRV